MAKQIIRALVALLATFVLFGCASTPSISRLFNNDTTAKPSQAPVTSVAPAVAKPSQAPVTNVASTAVDASKLASFQPFVEFGKGTGHGTSREYIPRSKEQIQKLLRDPKEWKRVMRVPCLTIVRQMAEVHGLPFEGCEGAAAALSSPDYQVVDCDNSMFQKNWLSVTDAYGKKFGQWHRVCLKGEKVLTYKGLPILSTTCFNVIIPSAPAVAPPAPAPATTAVCTKPLVVRLNVWKPGVLEKVAGLKQAVEANMTVDGTTHFDSGNISRDWGDPILRAAKVGNAVRSTSAYTYQVSIHKKGGGVVTVGTPPTITGEHTFLMPANFSEGDVMRVDLVDLSKFYSPTSSILARWKEFQMASCGYRNNFHAIER